MGTHGIQRARWGRGPLVLMVHGGAQGNPAGGGEHWAFQRPLAAEGWQLLLPDRPGHGRSTSRGPEDVEREAVWVAELAGEGAHLVGHSYGAAIALCAAARRSEAVHSLTLVEAPVFSVARARPEVRELASRVELVATGTDPAATLELIAFARAMAPPRGAMPQRPDLGRLRRMRDGLVAMRPPTKWDATAAVAAVRRAAVPTLVVTGGWNAGFETIADELARSLAGERLTIGTGHHFPHMGGHPPGAEFNRAVGSFLSAHR